MRPIAAAVLTLLLIQNLVLPTARAQQAAREPVVREKEGAASVSPTPYHLNPVSLPAIERTPMQGVQRKISLPGLIRSAAIGGGGRFLAVHLRRGREVHVIDMNVAKIVYSLKMQSEKILVAAGADKLVVVDSGEQTISRFNLADGRKELSRAIRPFSELESVSMGCASNGPLLVNGVRGARLFDLGTLGELSLETAGSPNAYFGVARFVRVSPDGRVFGVIHGGSPSGIKTVHIGADRAEFFYEHTSDGVVTPSNDGQFVFTNDEMRSSRTLDRIRSDALGGSIIDAHPALSGGWFFLVRGNDLVFSRRSDLRPLLTIPNPTSYRQPEYPLLEATHYRQLYYVPAADILVRLRKNGGTVELSRLDLQAELDRSDHFFIESTPMVRARVGDQWTYQIKARSSQGGLTYRVQTTWDGLTIDPNGLVSWSIPSGFKDPKPEVAVEIRDRSGAMLPHSFKMEIAGAQENLIASKARDAARSRSQLQEYRNRLVAQSPPKPPPAAELGLSQPAGDQPRRRNPFDTPEVGKRRNPFDAPAVNEQGNPFEAPVIKPRRNPFGAPAAGEQPNPFTPTAGRFEPRIWTDTRGRTIKATFVRLVADVVTLRTGSSTMVRVSKTKLSKDDQSWVDRAAAQQRRTQAR